MSFIPDEKDKMILNHLQENAHITHSELSESVALSQSGVQKRLRKLEDNQLVQRYTTIIDRKAFGFDLMVFVQVTLGAHAIESVEAFDEAVGEMPQILECHRLLGTADYLLKVIAKNQEELDQFLMKVLLPMPQVDRVVSSLVLKSVKETTLIELT